MKSNSLYPPSKNPKKQKDIISITYWPKSLFRSTMRGGAKNREKEDIPDACTTANGGVADLETWPKLRRREK